MEFTLLSGVVRNRKVSQFSSESPRNHESIENSTETISNDSGVSSLPSTLVIAPKPMLSIIYSYLSGNAIIRNFSLRVHKFQFKWDLFFHLTVCLTSMSPFAFSGNRLFAIIPLAVWLFYNVLFVIGTSRANSLVPGFGRFKHSFTASIEEFFSAKLLPVISVSFLLVILLLTVAGKRLGGPPLCYSSCRSCLARWSHSIPLLEHEKETRLSGCGYSNGRELLSYYTIAQTSYLMFVTVLLSMAVCMAWRVAEEEHTERQSAEEWLKREDPAAHSIRDDIMKRLGMPGTYIRPEGNAVWVSFGVVGALTFTLLGWHNWFMLPPSHSATLIIVLNLLTILTSMLTLHLSFFGRLLALYQRNYYRVKGLSSYLHSIEENQLDAWWNCRNFILNDDLGLDYDTAGLAVSFTFIIMVVNFVVLIAAIAQDGFGALREPPGSYCAYACMYFTMCLIKIFTIATQTFEEQRKHITGLHYINTSLQHRVGTNSSSLALSSLPFDYASHLELEKALKVSSIAINTLSAEQDDSHRIVNTANIVTPASSSTIPAGSGSHVSNDPYALYYETEDKSSDVGDDDKGSSQPLLQRSIGLKTGGQATMPTWMGSVVSAASFGYINSHSSSNPKTEELEKQLPSAALLLGASNKITETGSTGIAGSEPLVNVESNFINFKALSTKRIPTTDLYSTDDDDSKNSGSAHSSSGGPSNPSTRKSSPQRSARICNSNIPGISPRPLARNSMGNMSFLRTSHHGTITPGVPIGLYSSSSSALESRRQTLAEMISQIKKYDPYPCILGIPVMPALFLSCKLYIFICFTVIGLRVMLTCFHELELF